MLENLSSLNAGTDAVNLLDGMVAVAERAGQELLAHFAPGARPTDRSTLGTALQRNEALVAPILRDGLASLRPHARWADAEHDNTALPDGEWWVVDAVEGNVNHVHGLRDWGVTVTLLRDRVPQAAVVHQPLDALTWRAARGAGASLNGRRLQVGGKTQLDAAIATTGQAEAGQTGTFGLIGRSITAMLGHALLVRASVPSTFPMLQLANGQNDVFWQYACVLPGVAAGILFAQEAGACVSRIDGTPWAPGAPDILVATRPLHAQAVAVLNKHLAAEAA